MNFQKIPPVDTPFVILDIALKSAGKKATYFRTKLRRGDMLERTIKVEQERLKRIHESLAKSLGRVPTSFPSLNELPEFYQQLVATTLDTDKMRKALAVAGNGPKNVRTLVTDFSRKYARCSTKEQLLTLKRQAIGRISSILKRMAKELNYLEQCRKMLRTYPNIRTEFYTVAIAGFPNVGKSTLLNKMTGAKAETNAYAFTTKSLNMGSIEYRHNTIQFIDTPGTLARPEKMNDIEKQAYLAMKYAAHLIIYVYDLSEPYPLNDQVRLENEVKMYGKEIIRYLSKTDILAKEKIAAFPKKAFIDPAELKKLVTQRFEEDFL